MYAVSCMCACVFVYQSTRQLLVDAMVALFRDMQVLTESVRVASLRFAQCHQAATTLHDDALDMLGRYSVAQRSRDRKHALPMAFK